MDYERAADSKALLTLDRDMKWLNYSLKNGEALARIFEVRCYVQRWQKELRLLLKCDEPSQVYLSFIS